MGKFDGLAIFCDCDNTMTAKGDFKRADGSYNIPSANVTAVRTFVQEGGRFLMASGRNPQELKGIRELMPIDGCCICTNGSIYSFEQDKVLSAITLGESFLQDVRDFFREFPVRHWRVTDADFVNVGWDEGNGDPFEALKSLKAPFYKIAFKGGKDLAYSQALATYLKERYGDRYVVENSAPNFTEWYAKEGGKIKGIAKFCALNPSIRTTIALGDQENDIPMMRACDVGICVSDGSDEAKAAADVICGSSVDGAVVSVLTWLESGELETLIRNKKQK